MIFTLYVAATPHRRCAAASGNRRFSFILRDHGAVGFASVDSVLAQQIELSHYPESDNCEMMIKRVGEPYSRTLHDDEAGCVDSRQFVEVGAPEIFPRPLQVA